MNLPWESNFITRMSRPAGMKGAIGAWPSVTKMSPLGAVITSLGDWKWVSSSPRWPAVPSRISTLPSGDSLVTCRPLLPSLEMAPSVTQTLP